VAGSLAGLALGACLVLLAPVIVLRTDRGGIAGGLDVAGIVSDLRAAPGRTLMTGALGWVAALAGEAGSLLCGVGVLATAAYGCAAFAGVVRWHELGGTALGRPQRPARGRPRWWLAGPVIGALLGCAMVAAQIGTGGRMLRGFGPATSIATLAVLAVVLYLVALAAGAPAGWLARRWPTAAGVPALLLLAVGTVLVAESISVQALLLGRTLAGLGAGVTIGLAWGMTGQMAVARRQVRAALVAAAVLALVAGPVVTGAVDDVATWRLAFLAAVPVAIVAAALGAAAGIVLLGLRLGPSGGRPAGAR
jgi:hypothetical protein